MVAFGKQDMAVPVLRDADDIVPALQQALKTAPVDEHPGLERARALPPKDPARDAARNPRSSSGGYGHRSGSPLRSNPLERGRGNEQNPISLKRTACSALSVGRSVLTRRLCAPLCAGGAVCAGTAVSFQQQSRR
ncbi:hypothetical protein [Streptomyces sp. LN785]|uniref:hypothetical protein n=1 Tax=Streptomyces sp. LN785 TaxID=3112983 RepID=UPI003718E164